MTAVLPSISTDRPSQTVAVLPDRLRAAQLLTVTAHPVPPGVVVIAVRGEVDLFTSPLLTDAILAYLRRTGPPLGIDLTEVSFFGAAGLTILLTARDAAMAVRIRMRVVAHTRTVLLPLAITDLDGVFDISLYLPHALLRPVSGPDG